ncbi:MAG: hypothetical protein J5744_01145 [Oscillospiraceae bacterium]|nr:hypothetical protein [Oscillospiraceae bacterium]
MKKIRDSVEAFLESRETRRAFSTAVSMVVIASMVFTALLFSSSASAMEEERRIEKTGGDDVKNYISVPNLIRLAYEEPVYIEVHLAASANSEEIEVSILDEAGNPVKGMPFGIAVTDEKGVQKNHLDDNCDGLITVTGVGTGSYRISFLPCQGYRDSGDIEVRVEPPVEHVRIDVSERIINAGNVDTSGEDNQYGKPTRPDPSVSPAVLPGDTVQWVESSRELVRVDRVDVPVTDDYGNQLYTSVPELSSEDENGDRFLIYNDGTDEVSGVRADIGSDGTLAYAEVYDSDTEEWISCYSSVVDSCGYPVCGSDGETPVYKFSVVAPVVTVQEVEVWQYHGWQEFDGNRYYYDADGVPVTGSQVINGESYWFNDEGIMSSTQGIDVSTWNGDINWYRVKESGIDFVIIRIGFRGYSYGSLYEDDMFETYFNGAREAGLKVGVYFYTQAVSEYEAVEEASLCLTLLNGRGLNYPVFIDMEDAESYEARTNNLSNSQRTTIINAFCDTIRSGGYRAGLYANKYYLTYKINVSQLSSATRIWIAHYTSYAHPEYQEMYSMWQYSSTGSIPGIYGNVDLDISWM